MGINATGAVFGHIYAITHVPTGRYYIGQTRTRVKQRWASHLSDARKKGSRANCVIDRVIAAHPMSEFAFEVITQAESQEQLDNLERLWIIVTNSRTSGVGLNARHGGDGGGKISAESCLKMRESAKRRIANDPGWSQRLQGPAQESRRINGVHYSKQARKNFSAGQMRRYLNNPNEIVQMGIRNKIAGRISWANLTPEQRAARLKPMQAARWRRNGN